MSGKKTERVADTTKYNVYCEGCGAVFQPRLNSPNWWRAKKRADKGYLDAVCISGETHGCFTSKPRINPEAPYRVIGFNAFLEDYDIPCTSFVQAIKTFKDKLAKRLDTAFISGVSPAVQEKLGWC